MARTKVNQRSASRVDVPMGATGGRTPPSKLTIALLGVCVISALWALAMLMPPGRVAYYYFFAYSEFYMGVISLVALSITVMVGLVATDRLVLSIRQRVLLQSAHRTTGVIAVTALFVHVWTKLMEEHIRVIDIFIPFLSPGNRVFVGLGTMSGLIMVMVMWTGIARARFIGRGKPWMWRSVHAISYLMWPIALVHGLSAGRAAATYVTVSYVLCVLLVLVGLAVRLSVSLNRRKDFSSTSTGSMKPVGSLVPTAAPSAKKRGPGRRREADPMEARVVADRGNAPAAVLESWTPAVPPVSAQPAPVSPAPARSEPARSEPARSEPARSAPYEPEYQRAERYAEEERAPRSRRYAEEEPPARRYAEEDVPPAPRQRRASAAERFDEPTRPVSRRALEEDRPRYVEDEVPVPRSRRRVEDEEYDEPDGPRSRARRVVEENRATRSARYAEDEEAAPRSRRAAPRYADEDDAPAPRTRRRAEEEPPPRSRRYAEDDGYDGYEEARPRNSEARRSGAHTGEFRTGELRPGFDRTGEFRMDEAPASPRSRPARYAEDEDPAPRSRRDRSAVDRGGNVDRADSGRHSRSEFVDLAPPADPWGAADGAGYPAPDESPTLVDMASRRARRSSQQEVAVRGGTSRGARRSRNEDESADDQYWRQLRGEAQ
jgi:hypothetical protein